MRNISLLLLFLFLFGCDGRLPVKTGYEGRKLPIFSFLSLDSVTNIRTDSIPSEKPTVLFYFGPYCPYCKAQLDKIIRHMEELKGVQFLMISDYSFSEVKQFYNSYAIGKYANIQLGYDSTYSFANYFHTNAFPYIAIYGKDKKLKGVYIGITETKDILRISNW
jgi:thiol-disulfide isomerase/thioredoxin